MNRKLCKEGRRKDPSREQLVRPHLNHAKHHLKYRLCKRRKKKRVSRRTNTTRKKRWEDLTQTNLTRTRTIKGKRGRERKSWKQPARKKGGQKKRLEVGTALNISLKTKTTRDRVPDLSGKKTLGTCGLERGNKIGGGSS